MVKRTKKDVEKKDVDENKDVEKKDVDENKDVLGRPDRYRVCQGKSIVGLTGIKSDGDIIKVSDVGDVDDMIRLLDKKYVEKF